MYAMQQAMHRQKLPLILVNHWKDVNKQNSLWAD